jgi:hypothetical protein
MRAQPLASFACRWARDLSQQLPRTEVTRFPHAVLDIQMDAEATHHPPKWLQVRAAPSSSVVQRLVTGTPCTSWVQASFTGRSDVFHHRSSLMIHCPSGASCQVASPGGVSLDCDIHCCLLLPCRTCTAAATSQSCTPSARCCTALPPCCRTPSRYN